MAMFLNPLTGQMEDDGAPAVPVVAPVVAAPAQAPVVEQDSVVPMDATPQLKASESTTTSSQTKQVLPTANESGLQKQQEELFKKEQELQRQASEAGKAKAIEESAQADEKAKLAADKELKTQSIVSKGEEEYQKALAERNTQYDQLKNMKITDYWENQSTGNKILAGISIMLGGIGGQMMGDKSNRALDIISKAIDVDLETQKANIAKQLNVVEMSEKGISNAKLQQDYLLNNVNLVKDAAYGNIAEKYAASAKKRGISEQALINDATYNALLKKQNEAKMEYERGLRKTIDSGVQKQVTESLDPMASEKPTEGQGKARGYASRMVNATKNYDKVGGISPAGADAIRKHVIESYIEMKDAQGFLKYVLKPGAKPLPSGLSERDRLAWSAVEDFSRANLRKESGAAIGRDEFMDELNQILPTAGDTAGTLAAKRKLMSQKIASTAQEVGRAKVNIPAEPKGPALSADDKAALDWANANPTNPKAAEIKKELGL